MFLAEMAAARFVAGEGIDAHQLAELEEIGDASGAFQRLVERFTVAEDAHVAPEFFSQLWNAGERLFQTGCVPGHPAFVPKEKSELAMERIHGTFPVYREQFFRARADLFFRIAKFRAI